MPSQLQWLLGRDVRLARTSRNNCHRALRSEARSPTVISLPSPPVTILVVERDPHVRGLAAQFLAGAGYGVEVASDGEEALARARTLKPDLVVCEILVPKLDGLALCR